jgi:hypothetical protein
MTIYVPLLPDAEIDANRRLITAAILAHPLALLLTPATVEALVAILEEEPPADPAPERRRLRRAAAAIDSMEIAASLGVAA